jgi:hypothetical protein
VDPCARRGQREVERVLRVLSVLFATVAVVCMIGAIAGMVTERQRPWTGWWLRTGAVVCFGIAVALNVIAH